MNLSKNCKVTRHSVAVAAGTGDTLTPSAGIDMQGYEGCMFIVSMGAITATAVTSIKVQQSSDDGSSDAYADLTGTSVSIADSDDNLSFVIDVYRPQERYLKLITTRATANAVLDDIIAIQYGPRIGPTTHDATTVGDTETHVSPDEGTA